MRDTEYGGLSMAQMYLLSILSLVVVGLALSGEYLGEKIAWLASWKRAGESRSVGAGIGIAAAVVGVLKLIIRSPGETVPVAGDLLPGLTGIALGVVLAMVSLERGKPESDNEVPVASKTIARIKVPLGIYALVIAVIHFLLPGVTIL